MNKKTAKAAKSAKSRPRALKLPRKRAKPADPAPAAAPAPAPRKPTKVNISAAKGRPMLTWVGKRPLSHVTAFPAQLVEHHNAFSIIGIPYLTAEAYDDRAALFPILRAQCNNECWEDAPFIGLRAPEVGGLLLHGDNRDVLSFLLLSGYRSRVNCIYIDPPFDSAADYVRRVNVRGAKGSARLSGADYALGEQIQYSDIWVNDAYLQFMFERLLLMRELLAENGSFYLHADAHRVHHLRALLDEVFGADSFRNQISWKRTSAHGGANRFGAVTDFILFYGKGPTGSVWNPQFQEITQEHKERHYRHSDERGLFALGELTAPGITNGLSGQPWRAFDPRTLGRHWAKHPNELDRLDSEGLIYWPPTPGAWPRLKRYWSEHKGRPATDFWDDLDPINMVGLEREDYPTQKPEAIVERMLLASTNPGGLVLDCFIGSGTTAAVAQKLGRRWIGCDINKGAIQTTVKRLRSIIAEQIQTARKAATEARQGKLIETGAEGEQPPPKPCAFGFTVWRVNDYDLQIQHNEAVNLACEHIGIERTRSDSYFEGTLGKKLVKIIPFGDPFTPLDLEQLKRNLDSDGASIRLSTRLWCDCVPLLRRRRQQSKGRPQGVEFFQLSIVGGNTGGPCPPYECLTTAD